MFLLDIETAQKEAASKKIEQPKKLQIVQTELDELEDRMVQVKKLISAYTEQRLKLVSLVPDDFLETYVSMMKRIANPVLPIIKDACSGCSSGLLSSEIAKARAGEFVSCQGCYRMAYLFKLEDEDE